jgi:hypothetical protein
MLGQVTLAPVVDRSRGCRVTHSRGRSKPTDDAVNVLVEHSYEHLCIFDQSAEIAGQGLAPDNPAGVWVAPSVIPPPLEPVLPETVEKLSIAVP